MGAQQDSKDSDTIHVRIENEDSLRSDLAYLADKLGVDIEKLREERYREELAARQAKMDTRREKKERARLAREAALEKEFLDNYGSRDGHYLMTVGGKRIHKLKSFDEITCPTCGVSMPESRGFGQALVEMGGGHIYQIVPNPLSAWYGAAVRIETIKCKNRHDVNFIVQHIL